MKQDGNQISNKLDKEFTSDNLSSISYKGTPAQESYLGSKKQEEDYEKVSEEDDEFKSFIKKQYGSFERFKSESGISRKSSVFDPVTDYTVDVTIITSEKDIYTSDHISSSEVLLESLSGLCTFFYIKIDGTSGRTTGTLSSKFIPDSEIDNRSNFFRPLRGNRIVVWDTNKQRWNSFYMSRLIKFVRDETSGLQ